MHTCCNNNFALQKYFHSQLYTNLKHTYICNTPNSWLSLITIVIQNTMLKTTNIITIHIHEIKDHKWFTHQIENGNQWKSLYSPYLFKTQQKYNKIHVLWKCNQNNKSNLWYSTLESIVPLQSIYIFTLTPKMCIYKCLQTPKTLSLGQSPSIWTRKQNSTRIQNSNPSSV